MTYKLNAPSYREFVCAQLSQPLLPGIPVHLSMKVAPGGFGSYALNSPKWTSSGIGMLLTTQPFEWSIGSLFPNTAHLYLPAVLNDTTNWTVLSTIYVPDSAYQYITLGNFFEDSQSSVMLLDPEFGDLNGAYVFVDEVCIAPAGMACDFSNGIGQVPSDPWQATSPFHGRLVVSFGISLQSAIELVLYDVNARLVARRTIDSGAGEFEWPLNGLADGVYVLHCKGRGYDFRPLRVLRVSP